MLQDAASPTKPAPIGRPVARLDVAPYSFAAALALSDELGISHTMAQVLVRRGQVDPAAARAFLAGADAHDASAFAGIEVAVETILRHARAGSRVTVHGDYDVDGICSTAVLVRVLRRLGAEVDWYLPSRLEDGYGLAPATVDRLASRGTGLLICVDCAITAVDEVARARTAGLEVVVCDHHLPRPDGQLPAAPIVHPRLGGYPCPDLCATAVAHKLAGAVLAAGGEDPASADDDLDLVALATVADVVPLHGENRRLARAGMRALASTAKPGLRALMRIAQVDPGRVDAHAVGFRLAPRINAAGRLRRADAGLELVLTEDEQRAREVAEELDHANSERRHVETRIRFEAEAQVAAAGSRAAYVLAGEDWHPGVIGIVAARIAERHHRPTVVVAMEGDRGTGSGRSIPAFDLLAGLTAADEHLERYGGHRAAAGLELARERLDDFRSAFEREAGARLAPEDLVPVERVDAVVTGDALGLGLAEELAGIEPCGNANPAVNLLVPAATLSDPRPIGDGKHVRFNVQAGGVRSGAVAFGSGGRLPVAPGQAVDATFRLEVNEFNGAVEPRLVLGTVRDCAPPAIEIRGEPESFWPALLVELTAPLEPWPPHRSARPCARLIDCRGQGLAGTMGDLVATGEPVLVVCADVPARERALRERLGGFALCSWEGLERAPDLGGGAVHVVALDPPAHPHRLELLRAVAGAAYAHLAWGEPELHFAQQVHEREFAVRAPLAALYRALRDRAGAEGEELEELLRGDGPRPRSPALAGRLLRVLEELHLVSLDRDRPAVEVPAAGRTALERSAAFQAYAHRHEDGKRYLTGARARAA